MRHVVRPHVLFEIRHGQHRASFEQQDRHAKIREHIGDGATTGAGSNHDDVVDGGAGYDLGHWGSFWCGGE